MSSTRHRDASAGARLAAAEERLRSLELFGMRFGLDRMRRMMTVLGSPERRFRSLQVLGTNGKSSTTRMTAAIIEAHGLRSGAYLSPHLVSYRERVLVCGLETDAGEFADAIARAGWAAERVNRTLAEGDHVTQFELLTAAALWHMAQREVQVAVVEAGLGGRYDATSVIEPEIAVLTNVGLEHTRWLGPTVQHIAEEKLAAVPAGATLVLGEQLAPAALEVALARARQADLQLVRPAALDDELELRARGAFQRRNFALARAAAEAYLGGRGIALEEQLVRDVAARVEVPGRMQQLDDDPLTILDGAHNPHAAEALLAALPELIGTRPLALVLGVLEDKDAASMLAALLPRCARAWFTAPPSPRALSPAALASLARQQRAEGCESEPLPVRALAHAQQWAARHGAAVLVTGSVYLVGEVLAARQAASSRPPGRDADHGEAHSARAGARQ